MKHCTICGISKPITAFSKQKQRNGTYRYRSACKVCLVDQESKRYQKQTTEQIEKRRNKSMIRLYGIDLNQYNQLFENQKGYCLGCNRHQSELNKALAVDHCHKTGKVRGLLCPSCNLCLGNAKESVETLKQLAIYLEKTA